MLFISPSTGRRMTDSATSDHAAATPSSPEGGEASLRGAPSRAAVWSQLSKARLSALVLLTTGVGYVVAPTTQAVPEFSRQWWTTLGWTCLGTALAAASAAMLNQVAEIRRDSLMRRTARRPLLLLPPRLLQPRRCWTSCARTGACQAGACSRAACRAASR